METKQQFRTALRRLGAYRADQPTRRPAFTIGLGHSWRARTLGPRKREATVDRLARRGLQTLTSAQSALATGELSSVELMRQAYDALERWNPQVNAFEHVVPREQALLECAERDAIPSGRRGPLWGIPTTIKDVIHVAGMPTTASSETLRNYTPTEDAAAVARLRAAGAVIIGKTTTHEYAMGVTTPHSRNPWDITRDPGGSSGGAAITLATGMGLAALGTDTRASIRVPAALCGTVGFKPTFGLVPTRGVVTMSWTMDHVAPMARTTEDVAVLLNVLVGPDPREPTSAPRIPTDYRHFVGTEVAGLRVGIPVAGLRNADPGVLQTFQTALAELREMGVDVVDLDQPTVEDFELANAAGLIVSRCEAVLVQNGLHGAGKRAYNQDVAEQIAEAERVHATDYLEAQRFRGDLAERMARLFNRVDALVLPTSRVVAPRLEESDQYLLVLSENCVPWSFIGFPAMSVPCGLTAGLTVGLELVAAPYDEGVLLALGSAVEDALDMPVLPTAPSAS